MNMALISTFDTIVGDGTFGFSIGVVTLIEDGVVTSSRALFSLSYTVGAGFVMDLFWMPVL